HRADEVGRAQYAPVVKRHLERGALDLDRLHLSGCGRPRRQPASKHKHGATSASPAAREQGFSARPYRIGNSTDSARRPPSGTVASAAPPLSAVPFSGPCTGGSSVGSA